jgi:hypothetical protein
MPSTVSIRIDGALFCASEWWAGNTNHRSVTKGNEGTDHQSGSIPSSSASWCSAPHYQSLFQYSHRPQAIDEWREWNHIRCATTWRRKGDIHDSSSSPLTRYRKAVTLQHGRIFLLLLLICPLRMDLQAWHKNLHPQFLNFTSPAIDHHLKTQALNY